MSRKNADVQSREIDSSVWWKRKRSDRVLSLRRRRRRIWKTGAKGQGPCSSSSSICPFGASAFFRFQAVMTIFFLIIPVDHQSIRTRLTKFLRKIRGSIESSNDIHSLWNVRRMLCIRLRGDRSPDREDEDSSSRWYFDLPPGNISD